MTLDIILGIYAGMTLLAALLGWLYLGAQTTRKIGARMILTCWAWPAQLLVGLWAGSKWLTEEVRYLMIEAEWSHHK